MRTRHSGIVVVSLISFAAIFSESGVCEEKLNPPPAEKNAESGESVESLYRRASELVIEGKYREALKYYERLFKLAGESTGGDYYPGSDAGLYFDYGNCQLQAGEYREALATFRLVRKKYEAADSAGFSPSPMSLLLNRIQIFNCLRNSNRIPEAQEELKEVDRLLTDCEHEQRDKLVEWRKKVDEVFPPTEAKTK